MPVNEIKNYLLSLQDKITNAIEEQDGGATFHEDIWQHTTGGGGRTRVIQQGKVFEQGGINFSHVMGNHLPSSATAHRPELINSSFQALGVSCVLHPQNPYVPTTHLNVRFFQAEKADKQKIWWFGGGYDLTPYYGFKEDCKHWHQTAKSACDAINTNFYSRFKKAADDYFYIKHRQEARGIGGIFFDDLNELEFSQCFSFLQNVGDSFLAAYLPIVKRRQFLAFSQRERNFQCYRRGRYVEFNLVYDRGTLFGLQSGGRTESILMSLPPVVHWSYAWQPDIISEEKKLYDYFLKPRDWISE